MGAPHPSTDFSSFRVALIAPARLHDPIGCGWLAGAAPFREGSVEASSLVRSTYFNRRVSHALYGTDTDPTRWHRFVRTRLEIDSAEARVEALEFAKQAFGQPGSGFLIVHLDLKTSTPIDTLFALSRLSRDEPLAGLCWYEFQKDAGVTLAEEVVRITTLTFATPVTDLTHNLPAEYLDWAPAEAWLWQLASATPSSRYPPDDSTLNLVRSSKIPLSRDWECLVLRDGGAFLGLRPDEGPSDPFFRSAELYFCSIYLDALLLGILQRDALSTLADDLASLGDPVRSPERVLELDQQLTSFRNSYWWNHVTEHGHANNISLAYGTQHQLSALYDQLVGDLSHYSQQIQTKAASQTNDLLAVLTIVGLPLGVTFGILQTLRVESHVGLIIGIVVALLVAASLTFPVRKKLLRSMRALFGSRN